MALYHLSQCMHQPLAYRPDQSVMRTRDKIKQLGSRLLLATLGLSTYAIYPAHTAAQPSQSEIRDNNQPSSAYFFERQQQRATYAEAQRLINSHNWQKVEQLLPKLEGYPLKSYVEFALISNGFGAHKLKEVDAFLASHSDSPMGDRLQGRKLVFLANNNRWHDFNRYFTSGFKSTPMQCRSLLARYHTGDLSALDDAISIWAVGHSQPDVCDPLFALLEKHQKLTDAIRWSRFDKAINAGQHSLARFVERKMSSSYQALAKSYWEVQQRPKRITQLENFAESSIEMQQIISYGIRKLAQSNPKRAWQSWELYEAQRLFENDIALATKQDIVSNLIRGNHFKEAEQLLSYSHSLRSQSLIERLLRQNLAEQNWQSIAANIVLLDDDARNSERWQYWYARAHHELGSSHVDVRAIYEALASTRSWYGFLAADQLGKNYSIIDSSKPANPEIKVKVATLGSLQRAQELWALGEYQQARVEWSYALRGMEPAELVAAGELARDWGWYNSGIVAMISGNLWDHLTLRFPLAFAPEIEQAAARTQLEDSLLFAIARQESAFSATAVSHAGARGLMQLMPATAREQAKHSGFLKHSNDDLFEPAHNIHLGSDYLDRLMTEFDGNRILAAAAYNAGQHRVKRWLKVPSAATPADVWVEIIPFKETRQYVQNVLTYSVIYDYRRGENSRLLRPSEAKIAL